MAAKLITLHREHFEQHADADLGHALGVSRAFVHDAASEIIQNTAPAQLAKWQRKVNMIEQAQQQGKLKSSSPWLMWRLLVG